MDALLGLPRAVGRVWGELMTSGFGGALPTPPALAQTARDELRLDGGARLYHFFGARPPTAGRRPVLPVLIVPSLINRWYVLDLRPGAASSRPWSPMASTCGASTGASPTTKTAS
jgi:hypothetical protein